MSFHYEPLPKRDGEWIRVLSLHAGKDKDPINCDLLMVNLKHSYFKKPPKYEAISYVWGDPKNVQEITCEGRPLQITVNLFQALRRFRYDDRPRILWADGICIDQCNDVEKEYQVSIMGQIYEQSECTLIWLGEVEHFVCEDRHPSCVDDAILLIQDFNAYFESQYAKLEKDGSKDVVRDIHKVSPVPKDHPYLNDKSKWSCLKAFLSRPWFSRVWVLQEVGLSKRAIAFAGQPSMPFTDIALFVLVYDSTAIFPKFDGLPTSRIMDAFWSIWATFGMKESWMNENSVVKKYAYEMKLRFAVDSTKGDAAIMVLSTGRQFEASQDRDHVYAFLGHPVLRGLLKPDFGIALELVCLDLARKILLSGRSLNMLTYVDNSDDDILDVNGNLPSWVPQWHTSLTYLRYPHERWMAREIKETAQETLIKVSDKTLHIAALLLDTVDWCTPILGGPLGNTANLEFEKIQHLWQTFNSSAVESGASNAYSDRSLSSFIWTLVYGRYPYPPLLKVDFDAFRKDSGAPFFFVPVDTKRQAPDLTPVSSTRFKQAMEAAFHNKRFFTTKDGRCGMGPRTVRGGDTVALVFGCNAPLVLRPTTTSNHYKLAGSAFVFDMVYETTKIMNQWRNGSLQEHEVVLE